MLAADQRALAAWFATPGPPAARTDGPGTSHRGASGVPCSTGRWPRSSATCATSTLRGTTASSSRRSRRPLGGRSQGCPRTLPRTVLRPRPDRRPTSPTAARNTDDRRFRPAARASRDADEEPSSRVVGALVCSSAATSGWRPTRAVGCPATPRSAGSRWAAWTPRRHARPSSAAVAARGAAPVTLTAGGKSATIDPGRRRASSVDLDGSIADLAGFSLNPVKVVSHLTGGVDAQPRDRRRRGQAQGSA